MSKTVRVNDLTPLPNTDSVAKGSKREQGGVLNSVNSRIVTEDEICTVAQMAFSSLVYVAVSERLLERTNLSESTDVS